MPLIVDADTGYAALNIQQRQEPFTYVDMTRTHADRTCPVCQRPIPQHAWYRTGPADTIIECG